MKTEAGTASTTGSALRLRVEPRTSGVDEPLSIVVSGTAPGARVVVTASTRDGARVDWASHNTFQASVGGTVDLSRDAPIDGYSGVDPAGPLWTMVPVDPDVKDFFTKRRPTPLRVQVAASVDGGEPVGVEVERTFGQSVLARPAHGSLIGTLYYRDGAAAPAVIVLAGSDGGQLDHAAALLAGHGYAVLALSYFGAEDLPPTLAHVDLDYFRTAIGWLGRQPEVAPGRSLTVIGLSRGGELALQLASIDDRIGVVVAGSPSSVRQAGLTKNYTDLSQPAWESGGKELPFVKGRYTFSTFLQFLRSWLFARPLRQRRNFERALHDPAVPAATIEVERIAGPLLLLAGGDDQLWPSDIYARQVEERLRAHGNRFEVLNLTYPASGHFLAYPYGLPSMPPMVTLAPMSRLTVDFGGSVVANAEAAADSWPRLLDFLARHTAA